MSSLKINWTLFPSFFKIYLNFFSYSSFFSILISSFLSHQLKTCEAFGGTTDWLGELNNYDILEESVPSP